MKKKRIFLHIYICVCVRTYICLSEFVSTSLLLPHQLPALVLKVDFASLHGALTRCMAELRGGCGSISNWDGVCPKCWICASVACRGERERGRVAVTIDMHQSDGSMRYLTMQANPNSAMPVRKGGKGSTPNLPCPPPPPSACRVIQVLVWKRQAFSY